MMMMTMMMMMMMTMIFKLKRVVRTAKAMGIVGTMTVAVAVVQVLVMVITTAGYFGSRHYPSAHFLYHHQSITEHRSSSWSRIPLAVFGHRTRSAGSTAPRFVRGMKATAALGAVSGAVAVIVSSGGSAW